MSAGRGKSVGMKKEPVDTAPLTDTAEVPREAPQVTFRLRGAHARETITLLSDAEYRLGAYLPPVRGFQEGGATPIHIGTVGRIPLGARLTPPPGYAIYYRPIDVVAGNGVLLGGVYDDGTGLVALLYNAGQPSWTVRHKDAVVQATVVPIAHALAPSFVSPT